MKVFLKIIFFTLTINTSCTHQLSGNELLNKSIRYHDPGNNWLNFKGFLNLSTLIVDQKKRNTEIEVDLPKQFFKTTVTIGLNKTVTIINNGKCKVIFNGEENFSKEKEVKHGLSCLRAIKMRDYYTYLYGLPMKLKDPGTIVDSRVVKKKFKNKNYLVLKVNYQESVGKDTWYFYFNPKTYAMEVYQFFHDESKNDGEYIILEDIEEVNNIKMPKTRSWFYNKDDKYLARDILN
jgi:hypothetical protein